MLIKVLNGAMIRFQHGKADCVMCASGLKSGHTGVFPRPACYLLADSCLNITQAPIKIPETKNYYSLETPPPKGCISEECSGMNVDGERECAAFHVQKKKKQKTRHKNPNNPLSAVA